MRQLLLIRHGLPDYRVRLRADEPPGPPLSMLGHEQARQTAQVVAGFEPCAIHCSPLARTCQTAECVRRIVDVPVCVDPDLGEWHRTESLHDVGVRSARWLTHWWRGGEPCAVVVGHASPLLAMVRSALYLPHAGWWRRGSPNQPELDTWDRFDLSMAALIILRITPDETTAELAFHPEPRIMDLPGGQPRRSFPRPLVAARESTWIRRPRFSRLVGLW